MTDLVRTAERRLIDIVAEKTQRPTAMTKKERTEVMELFPRIKDMLLSRRGMKMATKYFRDKGKVSSPQQVSTDWR